MNERHPMGFSCDNMSNLKLFNEDFDISNPFTPGIHVSIIKITCKTVNLIPAFTESLSVDQSIFTTRIILSREAKKALISFCLKKYF